MRSRSSLGKESRREKAGSEAVLGPGMDGLLVDRARKRTGRLGGCGGASTMAVSEELLLPVDERDRECGVEVREAISIHGDGSLGGGCSWVRFTGWGWRATCDGVATYCWSEMQAWYGVNMARTDGRQGERDKTDCWERPSHMPRHKLHCHHSIIDQPLGIRPRQAHFHQAASRPVAHMACDLFTLSPFPTGV